MYNKIRLYSMVASFILIYIAYWMIPGLSWGHVVMLVATLPIGFQIGYLYEEVMNG